MDWLEETTVKAIKSKKISSDSSIRVVSELLSKVVHNKRIDSSYKPEIRVSRLPLCGLLHTKEVLEAKPKYVHFSMDFFSGIGNSVHELFQTHFPLCDDTSKYVFGDWRCKHCDKVTVERKTTPKNLKCPECKQDNILKYSELLVVYKGVTGHIDLILLIDGIYYIIDFKTTSAKSIEEGDKALPKGKHPMQIESYAIMLKEQHDIEISHWFLVYISRDSQSLEQAFNNKEHHFIVGNKITKALLDIRRPQLEKLAITKRLTRVFLANPTTQNLKKLTDNRPCFSLHDYKDKNTGMTNHFQIGEECPYQESCFSDAKFPKPAKEIWKLIKEKSNGR